MADAHDDCLVLFTFHVGAEGSRSPNILVALPRCLLPPTACCDSPRLSTYQTTSHSNRGTRREKRLLAHHGEQHFSTNSAAVRPPSKAEANMRAASSRAPPKRGPPRLRRRDARSARTIRLHCTKATRWEWRSAASPDHTEHPCFLLSRDALRARPMVAKPEISEDTRSFPVRAATMVLCLCSGQLCNMRRICD